MHPIQKKLLNLIETKDISNLKLREIGELIQVQHPQKIKHHIGQLEKKGLVKYENGKLMRVKQGLHSSLNLINIPVLGAVNAGPAALFAEENLEGYLKVSPNLLPTTIQHKASKLFALRAEGNSMNDAKKLNKPINQGDYILVSEEDASNVKSGDYIITVIDGMANVKRLLDKSNEGRIVLLSESKEQYPPIYLTPEDNFTINAKVLYVLEKP